jgi:hypothetical protein
MMTLSEFLTKARISKSYFYSLAPEDRPAIVRLSPRKQFVTDEAFREWVSRRNAEAA